MLVTNGLLVLAIEQDCQPTCHYGGGSNVLVKISSLNNGAINKESCGSLKLSCSCQFKSIYIGIIARMISSVS